MERLPEVAQGFLRVTSMEPSPYKPPEPRRPTSRPEGAEGGGEGGPESLPPTGRVDVEEVEKETTETLAKAEKGDERSEAEKAADAMIVQSEVTKAIVPGNDNPTEGPVKAGDTSDEQLRAVGLSAI